MDRQCRERDVGVQITAHQVDSSAITPGPTHSCSNEWMDSIWIQMKSNVIDKTEHTVAINDQNAQGLPTFERSLDRETGDYLPTYPHKKFKRPVYSALTIKLDKRNPFSNSL
jgi:hypothetical protein